MSLVPQIAAVRRCLVELGYQSDWLRDVPLGSGSTQTPLVAFSGPPFDARTACIGAIQGNGANFAAVAALRHIGAPLTIVAGSKLYEVWRQQANEPAKLDNLKPEELSNYFERNRTHLEPNSVYRAKVWGRLEAKQQDFVDIGLLPILEEEMGSRITALIERVVGSARESLGWTEPSERQGQWLLQSVFWLLAAKILQDKEVERFRRLNLEDFDTVFERLSLHYNSGHPQPAQLGQQRRDALVSAAGEIKRFADLRLLSTEALGYLYESALIDDATRQSLGTHTTPSWMVDYMLGKLRPLIENIDVAERRVFEPACGHAAFLIAALRLLSELRPLDYSEDRRTYLRKRLRGVEIDSFAVDIAKLSLTLADVPNPNGWALDEDDMFKAGRLEREAANASIVLSNPPFERFSATAHRKGWQYSKATETLRRVLENLPNGGVFGFVLPYNFLVSKQDAKLRQKLLAECEVSEVSFFADKVFRCGAPETAVLIGRKVESRNPMVQVLYQRVREGEVQRFKDSFEPSSREYVPQSAFVNKNRGELQLSELSDIWDALSALPRLKDIATVGQGFSHKSIGDRTAPKSAIRESATEFEGSTAGFAAWDEHLMTHELPATTYLNLDKKVIGRPRQGRKHGKPQVILNYPRVSREAWCLKALIDQAGHPFTSDFSVARPNSPSVSLSALWAILNSPLSNAYAHAHSGKRHVLVNTLKTLPVPRLSEHDLNPLESAVSKYLERARAFRRSNTERASTQLLLFRSNDGTNEKAADKSLPTEEELQILHWRIDAEVLRLYSLPEDLEQKLLKFFTGIQRRGVPFSQKEYLPQTFMDVKRLSELIAITEDWDTHADRMELLVERKIQRTATASELAELREIKKLASARRELFSPMPLAELDRVEADLVRRGVWRKQ